MGSLSETIDFDSSDLVFYVNESLHKVTHPSPKTTTLEYLRQQGYTGTKLGCGEGGCGACTVVIASLDSDHNVRHLTANACLLPLCTLQGKQVITIEGIGCPSQPHAVQERLALGHGAQCGFCTPGIVMSMYGLLQTNPEPSICDIEDSFEGNLCRCTGYRPIFDSMKTFAKEKKRGICSARDSNLPCEETIHSNIVHSHHTCKTPNATKKPKILAPCEISELADRAPYDSKHDVAFPSYLKNIFKTSCDIMHQYEKDECKWFRPTRLEQLLTLKKTHPEAKLVGGNSEIGVEMKLKSMDYRIFIDTSNIAELRSIQWEGESMVVGVNISLTEFIDSLQTQLELVKPYQKTTLEAFLSNLRWFAGRQIRNFATLGGNIVTGSPISDLNPIFMACDATLTILSRDSESRQVAMKDFYKGYRQMDLQADEVVLQVHVPLASSGQYVRSYKQARRKDDDIAIVNAAFNVKFNLDQNPPTIESLKLAYGGVGPTTILLKSSSDLAAGLKWSDDSTFSKITSSILSELNLPYSVVGGMPSYRRTLATSFFKRFWYQTSRDINLLKSDSLQIQNIDEIEREETSGIQKFGPSVNHNPTEDPLISQTYPHLSALPHTTGAAQYTDDIPTFSKELYAASVLSAYPHAKIISVDPSSALACKGVHQFINHTDVPCHNDWGIITHDEEFFATEEVHYVGQQIGIILADSKENAKFAAQKVKVEYQQLPFLLTIDDAIKHNSFYDFERHLTKGDFNESHFQPTDDVIIIEGECHIGGQEHFYLETQGCVINPKPENGEIEVFSSTQNLMEAQMEISRALGIPANRVTCKTKRLGGGFGGKETRATVLAVSLAVAANATGRPVRCMLDRDEDMLVSGNRHPFYSKYRIAVTKEGMFRALDLEMIANAGWTFDLSRAVLERAVTHCDNVYNFPIMRIRGKLAKTNIASNTAFRGFGGPQGMMITEMMVSEIADKLEVDILKIRRQNFYESGQITHYDMKVNDWYIPEMWDDLLISTKYNERKNEIEIFNKNNKWRKRGLAAIPTKYGISFGQRFLNQAGALVLIYTDGSVLLNHGGVEMGQGLHTKMVQLCANALKVPLHRVHITESSTDKIANASPTAASSGSDLNGMAILDACRQLNERLAPYRERVPSGDLGQIATLAYFDMVNLGANGYYKAPNKHFDWETGKGGLFLYFTSGVAVAEVELDTLTGDHVVSSVDMVMDIGNSINFSVDMGQIEGAFVQGMGWCTMEEILMLRSNGKRLTLGPGNYKIPGFRDVPQNFNVSILSGKPYNYLPTVKSSKGIGEPPLFLGASVFFALRDAVCAARKENSVPSSIPFNFPSPATAEILRLACGDSLVNDAEVVPTDDNDLPWAVRL